MSGFCDYDEATAKDETIRKLNIQIGEWMKKCDRLEKEVEKTKLDFQSTINECEKIKRDSIPLKESLNSMTSERSKLLRKLKRKGIKL